MSGPDRKIGRVSDATRELDDIARRIILLEHQSRSRMAEWLRLVGEFHRRRGVAGTRFGRTADWLADKCAIRPRTARDQVRVATRLADMPLVAQAFGDGRLSYSQVRAITRAHEGEDEAELLRVALTSTVRELELHVQQLRSAPSADPAVANAAHARRYVTWIWQEDGSLSIFGRLGPDAGQALIEAIEEGVESINGQPAHWQEGPRPSRGARRADALTELALSGAPKTQLMLHADLTSLQGLADGATLHLDAGPSIPPGLAQRLICDCEITLAGLNLGRSVRLPTPRQRKAVEQRDGRVCSMPGCARVHGLQAHHIRHWTRGGPTDLDNLTLLCHFHHRLFHDDSWTMTRRADGGLEISDPRGNAVQAVAERASPGLMIA